MGPQISTSSTATKRKPKLPAPDRESSSDSEESEQGEVFPLALSSDGSRSSSEFEPSESSSDEEESECHDQNRENIILNHIDDLRIDGDESSSSFHDSSSDDSSDGDMDMPDLFTDSDESDMEPAVDPNLDVHNDDNWEFVFLEKAAGGKYVSGRTRFPAFTPPTPPGPVNIPPATSFPVDFFHLYLDPSIMEVFVANTNIVGAKLHTSKKNGSNGSHMGRWNPTCLSELYRLFAVLMHMGIKRQPTMRSYWSQDPRYSDGFVKKCFTRDRFEMLKSALHVVNPAEFTSQELKEKQKDDPFWRVAPFTEHLSAMYRRYFLCDQNIDIDEMCIGFKGRHIARCYNPSKPEKWHLKAFCLNDSTTGYLHRFYMYQGLTFYLFFNVPNMTRYENNFLN